MSAQRLYTAADDAEIRSMIEAGAGYQEIARSLRRTHNSLYHRVLKLGLKSKVSLADSQRKYDPEPVILAWAAGMTGAQIDARFGMKRGNAQNIVTTARTAGDPRAAARGKGQRPDGEQWHGRAVTAWEAGASYDEIAAIVSRSKKRVYAMLSSRRDTLTRPLPTRAEVQGRVETMKQQARFVALQAVRADVAARLPALLAEHGSLRAVAKVVGRRYGWLHGVMTEAGIKSAGRQKLRARKPVVVKAPKLPKPRRLAPRMTEGDLIRQAGLPPKKRAAAVYVPDGVDPKLAKAWTLIARTPDLDPWIVREKTGCELRMVYQIRSQLRGLEA